MVKKYKDPQGYTAQELYAFLQTPDWDCKLEREARQRATSPAKAIRTQCITCVGGDEKEIRECTKRNCPLFAFRMGSNPFHGLKPEDLVS